MLKLSIFLLTISLSIPSLSQYVQSFEDMNKKDMKKFLLENGNEEVQYRMKKYKTGQNIGAFLTISSLSMVAISASTIEKNQDNRNDLAALDNLLVATLGGIVFVTGIATLISSEAQFNKAEDAFFKPNIETNKKLEFKEKFKENKFLPEDSISPEIALLATKYQKTKKASKILLWSSISSLMVGGLLYDRMSDPTSGTVILNTSALLGTAWLTTDIIANRKLRAARQLHMEEEGLTQNSKLLDLDLRDDQVVYNSIFNN